MCIFKCGNEKIKQFQTQKFNKAIFLHLRDVGQELFMNFTIEAVLLRHFYLKGNNMVHFHYAYKIYTTNLYISSLDKFIELFWPRLHVFIP